MATCLALSVSVVAGGSAQAQQVRDSLCEAAKASTQQAVVQINNQLQRYAECIAQSSGGRTVAPSSENSGRLRAASRAMPCSIEPSATNEQS